MTRGLWIRILETTHTEDSDSAIDGTECVGSLWGSEDSPYIRYQPHARAESEYASLSSLLAHLTALPDSLGVVIDPPNEYTGSVLVITIAELRAIAGGAQ